MSSFVVAAHHSTHVMNVGKGAVEVGIKVVHIVLVCVAPVFQLVVEWPSASR